MVPQYHLSLKDAAAMTRPDKLKIMGTSIYAIVPDTSEGSPCVVEKFSLDSYTGGVISPENYKGAGDTKWEDNYRKYINYFDKYVQRIYP